MSEHSYFRADLENDMKFLVGAGLIEVAGIDEDGDWLYQPTAKGKAMSLEMMQQMIEASGEEE